MRTPSSEIIGMSEFWSFDKYVDMLPNKGKLLEIGTFVGKSAVAWAEAFERAGKDWDITTIDSFKGNEKTIAPIGVDPNLFKMWMKDRVFSGEEQQKVAEQNLNGWDNITGHKVNFDENTVRTWNPTVLFYDGDHSYKLCSMALEMYNDVDYILVDDYLFNGEIKHPGTHRAVNEHKQKYDKILTEGKIALLTKR